MKRLSSKGSHWIWYIFPQLRGLGQSEFATYYGLTGLAEAKEYLEHGILGPRLKECVEVMNALQGISAVQVLGDIDAMKFRSCLTLFALAVSKPSVFTQSLGAYFAGQQCERTLELLRRQWVPQSEA